MAEALANSGSAELDPSLALTTRLRLEIAIDDRVMRVATGFPRKTAALLSSVRVHDTHQPPDDLSSAYCIGFICSYCLS